jgi:hypothetical protein
VVEWSGFVTVASAGPEPSETNDRALVQPLPGRRMIWEVASALRCFMLGDQETGRKLGLTIAVTAAWTVSLQVDMLSTGRCQSRSHWEGQGFFSLSCGSFMSPNMTLLWLLYVVAMEAQRAAKTSLVGPPWPIMALSKFSC